MIGLIIIIVIIIILFAIIWVNYNSLVDLKNKVEESFSTMDVYLKKRWDLIPNLVETVKGYCKQEQNTLTEVTKLRSKSYGNLSDDEKVDVNAKLTEGIQKLLAVAENYPELKSNENFINLSQNLNKVEDDIANARKYYNGTVRNYNNKVEMFPSNIIASMFHFEKRKMYEITDEKERENVKVQF